MNRPLLHLLGALLLVGCSYAAPVDRSGITSAVALPGGGAGVVFRQLRYAPAAGIAAYPDGGIPHYLQDDAIVAVLAPDRPPRVLKRIGNPGSHGTLEAGLRRSAADPEHLLVVYSGQAPDGSTSARWARAGWRDGSWDEYPDFRAELKAQGREFGSSEFGDLRVLDAAGAVLVGAKAPGADELWVYQPGGGLRRLDAFEHFYGVAGDELYYWSAGQAVVRNWRTGAVRVVARYDPATRITTTFLRNDPTVKASENAAPSPPPPVISGDGRSVQAGGAVLTAPSDW